MSDNQGNPLKGSETDLQKATKAVNGLLNPKEEETIGQQEAPKQEIEQNSPEPQNEESEEDQPQEQEISEETESEEEEVSEQDVSQDEEQIDTQEKLEDSPSYTVKVNGQELDVTLDELRNGYSRDADYRQKTEELSNQRKNFQSESEKQRQDYSQKLNELNQRLSTAQQNLNAEINSADLDRMYDEDPTEAARIEHRLRRKQEVLNDSIQKTEAARKQEKQKHIMEQHYLLKSKMPELSDPSKLASLSRDLNTNLKSYGFTDHEINDVSDHRIILLVRDAMRYRNMQNSKPNIAKKITKPSKPFSSGVKQGKSEANLKLSREKFSRLKSSGSMKAAQDVFLDMITKK